MIKVLGAVLVALGCGCGGGASDPPALPPDADEGSVCELPPGIGYLLNQLHIGAPGVGFDLDGDGDVDNRFGDFPLSTRNAIGDGYDGALAAGEWLAATYLDALDDPPSATDPEVGFHILNVLDADVPADASNNFTGSGEFYAATLFLDLNCESTTRTGGGMVDRVFRASRPRLDFPLNTGTGAIELINLQLEVSFDETFTYLTGRVGAQVTLCSLSGMPLPLQDDTTGSALDYMINDPAVVEAAPVDADLDGDGLEQVIGDGTGVLECIDGDGTVIPGRDCPCHPAIADAYSVTLEMEAVRVRLLGVR